MLFKAENVYDPDIDRVITLLEATSPKELKALVKAIIAKESSFNPEAYRYEAKIKDASRGLMQILLRTARGEGFAAPETDLFKPATNIYYGTKYFMGRLKRYGNIPDALSAYNAGRPLKRSDGTYVNQFYVDRALLYYDYFRAKDSMDVATADKIEKQLKKKLPKKGI